MHDIVALPLLLVLVDKSIRQKDFEKVVFYQIKSVIILKSYKLEVVLTKIQQLFEVRDKYLIHFVFWLRSKNTEIVDMIQAGKS